MLGAVLMLLAVNLYPRSLFKRGHYFNVTKADHTPFGYLFTDKFFSYTDRFTDNFNNEAIIDISTREDNDFFYYDITVADLNSPSISTSLVGGFVIISGASQKNEENKDERNIVFEKHNAMFIQVLPVPANTDRKNMQIINEKNKVILAFSKLRI